MLARASTLCFKKHFAVFQRKQRVISAHADILTRAIARAALPNEDVPGQDGLAAKAFDAKPFGF